MSAPRIVPAFNEIEDGERVPRPASGNRCHRGVPLERVEEAPAGGIVVCVADAAHLRPDASFLTALAEGDRGVLATLVGMMNDIGRPALRHGTCGAFLKSAKILSELGIILCATKGTAEFLRVNGIDSTYWPLESASLNTLDYLQQRKIDLVINIPKSFQEEELSNDYLVRRRAVDPGVPLITNIQFAQRFVEAISQKNLASPEIKNYGYYVLKDSSFRMSAVQI